MAPLTLDGTRAPDTTLDAEFKGLPFNSSKQTFIKITFLRNIFMFIINKNTFNIKKFEL